MVRKVGLLTIEVIDVGRTHERKPCKVSRGVNINRDRAGRPAYVSTLPRARRYFRYRYTVRSKDS